MSQTNIPQGNAPAVQQPKSVANFLNSPNTAKFLEATLAEKRAEFVSNLIAMADSDANIAACEPAALMKCALNATALNLPLNKNLGYAYIIPYNINVNGVKVMTPNFQIGYKGLIQLAIRTGAYKYINATEIREGEIKRNKITGEITFINDNPSGKIVGYMAYLELLSGFTASLYMTEDEIESHALRFSKMYAADKQYKTIKSKWSDRDARPKMALKTVLKGLLGTYGLMTTEFEKALSIDNEESEPESTGGRYTEAEVINQPEPVQQSEEPEKIQI
jgi:recombination protein RecT